MSWIAFDELGESPSGKTMVWAVRPTDRPDCDEFELGRVKWFAQWRRYAFYPKEKTLFEQVCLREIADFCERQTLAHKSRRADQEVTNA